MPRRQSVAPGAGNTASSRRMNRFGLVLAHRAVRLRCRIVARCDVAPGDELTPDYFAQPVPERYRTGTEAARLRGRD